MTTILNVISFLIKSKAIIPYLGVLIQQLYSIKTTHNIKYYTGYIIFFT